MSGNTLLSFIGNQDPTGKFGPGPILSLLENRPDFFQEVLLFYNPDNTEAAEATQAAIAVHDQKIKVTLNLLKDLDDPTCHADILRYLRAALKQHYRPATARYFISIASGTPAMHACWFILAASGEIVATLLHIAEARFGTSAGNRSNGNKRRIREIDPMAREFPQVRPYASLPDSGPSVDAAAYAAALQVAGIHGQADSLHRTLQRAAHAASSTASVLIRGATGTGKELLARFIHQLSPRANQILLPFNCSTSTETMIDADLFGHTKGAFTGATGARSGRFQAAHKGTLFLDEIGDMPPVTQAKVLRAIEYGEITPVGADAPLKVNVRLVCATHRDLGRLISDNQFREDLYYRINTVELYLPSLDERREDIPLLAEHFIAAENSNHGKNCRLSADARVYLVTRNWPGNIRELRGLMARSVIYALGDTISAADLQENAAHPRPAQASTLPELGNGFNLKEYMNEINRSLYRKALAQTGGNQSRAAFLLGVSPQAVGQFVQADGGVG